MNRILATVTFMIQLGSVDMILNSRRFKYLGNDVSNERILLK